MAQIITTTMSRQFGTGGSKIAVDTWHKLTNGNSLRNSILISNGGVNNDLSTGTNVYVIGSNSTSTPTVSITDPTVMPLGVGDTIERNWGNDVIVSIQCATADVSCRIEESSHLPGTVKQTRPDV